MAVEAPRTVGNPGYYLEEKPLTPPIWIGNAARELGIEGKPVEDAAFLNLCDGYTSDADGNRDKKLPKYVHPDRVQAIEITVNCPKCVTTLNLVAGDRRIDDVVQRSYEAVWKAVEEQALVRATKKEDTDRYRQTKSLIGTIFDHSSNRLGSPHRHGHLVFMNLSKDGRTWKAIELGLIGVWEEKAKRGKRQEKPKGFAVLTEIFNDTMRQGLNELGYKTKADGRSFKVVGFPAEVKAKFSDRQAAIEEMGREYEAKSGKAMSAKAKRKLNVYDRPDKPDDKPIEERRKGWIARLTDPQYKAVKGVVTRAKERVRDSRLMKSFNRWQRDISRHASQLRNNVIFHETEAPERSHGESRGR